MIHVQAFIYRTTTCSCIINPYNILVSLHLSEFFELKEQNALLYVTFGSSHLISLKNKHIQTANNKPEKIVVTHL